MPRWISVRDKLPKKRTRVLVIFKEPRFGGGNHIAIAEHIPARSVLAEEYLDPEHWCGEDDELAEYVEDEDAYYVRENWFESNFYDDINYRISAEVIGWQPLPEDIVE